ncbi:MAG: MiaB/RimO family radical SAM methylthiotransferase, partial [Candidatus Methanomethylophilaceae archaeon]|nr:MiaB/RimO family radical SAM methylthiotransferase [Candidatus Methanomethylophilaceae archaeon]
RMNRGYTSGSFPELIESIREIYPEISIATDIITGFPGETDEDHAATKDLIVKLRADTLNITRFSTRPGTAAFSMEQVHGRIAKERSAELTGLKNSLEYEINSRLVGKTFTAVASEIKTGTIMRTDNYRPVAIPDILPLGTRADVEITGCRSTYLAGKLKE